jgi:hypothetical protein
MNKKITMIVLIAFMFSIISASAYENKEKLAAEFLAYKDIIISKENPIDYKLDKNITRKEMAKVAIKLS